MSEVRSVGPKTPRTPRSHLQNGVLSSARSNNNSPYPTSRPSSGRLDDPSSLVDAVGISLPSSAVVAALYKEREEKRKLLHQLR